VRCASISPHLKASGEPCVSGSPDLGPQGVNRTRSAPSVLQDAPSILVFMRTINSPDVAAKDRSLSFTFGHFPRSTWRPVDQRTQQLRAKIFDGSFACRECQTTECAACRKSCQSRKHLVMHCGVGGADPRPHCCAHLPGAKRPAVSCSQSNPAHASSTSVRSETELESMHSLAECVSGADIDIVEHMQGSPQSLPRRSRNSVPVLLSPACGPKARPHDFSSACALEPVSEAALRGRQRVMEQDCGVAAQKNAGCNCAIM